MEIEDLAAEIERFVEQAAQADGIKAGSQDELEPASEEDIAAFLVKHKVSVPDDVRRFWRRGLKYRKLSLAGSHDSGKTFASAGFDWLSLMSLERHLRMFRGLAENYEDGSDEKRLYEHGVPLSYSEPQLVVDPRGGIAHVHSADPLMPPVASSLSTFLEHWLESGCFTSHRLSLYFPKIQHLVPGRIPPEKNLWMTYYAKTFPKYV
jgi:hypothetical protein